MGQVARHVPGQMDLMGKVVPFPVKEPQRDPVWDTLEEIFMYQPRTKTERAEFGFIVRSFHEAGATPDELREAAATYRKAWPDVDLTWHALEKWFGHMLAKNVKREAPAACPDCGIGGGFHAADCPTVVPGPPH